MNKSIGYYCLRYAGISIIVALVLAVLESAAYAFFPDFANAFLRGNSGVGVAAVVVPSLLVGQHFYSKENRKLRRGESWTLAFLFTVICFALSLAFFGVSVTFGVAHSGFLAIVSSFWAEARNILLSTAAILFLFYMLMNWVMLATGVRGAINTEKKRAAKIARDG